MNKYYRVLERIKDTSKDLIDLTDEAIKVLQEAIEKAQKYDELMTPKKVIVDDSEYVKYGGNDYQCPSCNSWLMPDVFMENHCFNCGQALDWSE